ncbi:sodium/hydrogen exchanger 7 isoform X3 [Actinidia eriantha]|uniref:sodium/hydrogen exchanger 7 isoform X3 n=1 Tax=Actinidia eriantha TaxID=165200 RepID=UPI00258384BC|nr:sodium/hydrogen exchanger 7 isoform X3 [Actinidia eriantha]
MASVEEGPSSVKVSREERSSSNPTNAVIFFAISLVLGIASRHILRGTRVPYTVALLVLGIGLGSLEYGTSHRLGKVGDGIRLWANIDPNLLLAVFLPALLFESSFSMEVHQIKRCMAQMTLLAGPGVLISTICLGSALKLTFPYDWSWKTSLLLGGLLSATDPVAVVALLKELGASKKLSTIIEGESLMNDGTAIVVYQLFYRMVLGQSFNFGAVLKFLTEVSLGAVGIGLAFGIASVLWLGFIFNDTVIEIALTLTVSYVAYFTAQEGADVSGVLAVMTLGMFYAAVARTAFKDGGQQSLRHFWEMVGYIANTLIFILSGVVIAEGVLSSDNNFKSNGNSWGYAILLYIFVQVSRVIVVGVLYPFLRYFGYGLDWKEATILVWSGLRGAVALSLSLSVKQSSGNSYVTSETGTLFVFFTCGIVFLTLIVNGSTTQFVLRFLNMDKLSPAKRRILDYTKYEMLNKALEAFGDLGDDEELGPVDWPTVKRYISSLNHVEGERVHPHSVSGNDNNLDCLNLKDIRIRLLNGDSEIASKVNDESEAEGEEARKFLEDVRVTFPEVLRVVKTRQATYSVLNHLIDYVQNLEKVGLLEEKEMIHLHDAVQTDLKRLLRNPPLVKIPKIHDLVRVHPLLGALPSDVREPLVGSTKEIMKLGGVTLYKEGFKPNGIWLISNGVVKWTSKSIRNKYSLHPTFIHGSTLGLYEVLIGKPYICDMITDSVVLGFFVEAEKIHTMLRSYPAVEHFLWQESAIILAKFLLPQIFENMAMQDLRALVAERSILTIHIRGETIEIPHRSIGFLLEGFVKTQGVQEELITSPAALLPSYGDLEFPGSETPVTGARQVSFSHQGSWYHVETRARVIVFDIAAFEANRALQRKSSSLVPHSVDHPSRSLSREHFGLMSWPEQFYKSRQHHQNPEGTDQQATNLSARAMQLSVFGSMVNQPRWRPRNFRTTINAKPTHSLSYPRVPSSRGRTLVSVRSEGSTTVRTNLDAQKHEAQNPAPELQTSSAKVSRIINDWSDESGTEDELIIRIDSPSRLSFRQAF